VFQVYSPFPRRRTGARAAGGPLRNDSNITSLFGTEVNGANGDNFSVTSVSSVRKAQWRSYDKPGGRVICFDALKLKGKPGLFFSRANTQNEFAEKTEATKKFLSVASVLSCPYEAPGDFECRSSS
jgi:hypothetical protein